MHEIKKILPTWSPIEVPDEIAMSEYEDYAPRLARLRGDEVATVRELETLLTDTMGLQYDPSCQSQRSELISVAVAICKASAGYR